MMMGSGWCQMQIFPGPSRRSAGDVDDPKHLPRYGLAGLETKDLASSLSRPRKKVVQMTAGMESEREEVWRSGQ